MRIIEQSYTRLMIRFGNAILPVVIFIGALILGLALAVYSSATDSTTLLVLSTVILFAGLVYLSREQHVTLTFDRAENTLDIAKRRAMVPSAAVYSLSDIRGVTAICSGGVSIDDTPPAAKVRCALVIDFTTMPDYAVKRNLKRAEAAEAIALIRQFLDGNTFDG